MREKKFFLLLIFLINNNDLIVEKDFFPFIFSNQKSVEANASPSLLEKGMPWFLDIKDILEKNKNNPHFDVEEAIKNNVIDFARKGASAVIVYNTGAKDDGLTFDGKEKSEEVKIPVVFVTKEATKKFLSDKTANYDINLSVALGDKKRTGS